MISLPFLCDFFFPPGWERTWPELSLNCSSTHGNEITLLSRLTTFFRSLYLFICLFICMFVCFRILINYKSFYYEQQTQSAIQYDHKVWLINIQIGLKQNISCISHEYRTRDNGHNVWHSVKRLAVVLKAKLPTLVICIMLINCINQLVLIVPVFKFLILFEYLISNPLGAINCSEL